MCGRFVSSTPVSVLAEQFSVAEVKAAERGAAYNVAPSDEVYAVATTGGRRKLGTLSWGLVPRWVDDASAARRLVNLRAETVSRRPGFRRALRERRCVIPADGIYEWKDMGPGRRKQPFLVRRRDGAALALAGLWDVWRGPDGHGPGPGRGDALRTCTVLTTEPNELVAPVHDRMPVILTPEACETWLDDEEGDVDLLSALLVPCPAALLEMWPVSADVGDVGNDGPWLVEPLPGQEWTAGAERP